MKTLSAVIICVCFSTLLGAEPASLTLRIAGIRHMEGNLMIALYDSKEAFNDDGEPVDARRIKVSGKTMKISFDELQRGTYAIMLYQDRNENSKLDAIPIIGIPREPYGISNNPKLMGSPRFHQAAFEVRPGDNAQVIYLSDDHDE